MGFEEVVPKVPTRGQELEMIATLEKEWLAQPSYKVYMNEAPRRNKIEQSEKLNTNYLRWGANLCIGAIITGPVIVLVGRLPWFNRKASGVPFYRSPRYYNVQPKSHNNFRFQQQLMFQIPLWIFCSVFYANRYTNRTELDDEYFSNKAFKKML